MQTGNLAKAKISAGLIMVFMVSATVLWGQEQAIRVIDMVEFQSLTIEFLEEWVISPDNPALRKTVRSYTLHHRQFPDAPQDSLMESFISLVLQEPGEGRPVKIRKFSYEFELMDPSSGEKNNLHDPISRLVKEHSTTAGAYDLDNQLGSVWFREVWRMDPVTHEITRTVHEITPVIWQQRQTTEGEPVNDAETGLPVYYKSRLQPVTLRNL